MRVALNQAACQGHTLCALSAPAVFGLRDDDGHAEVLLGQVPAAHEDAVRAAAAGCPERAISIVTEVPA
jgi:ferredoxin